MTDKQVFEIKANYEYILAGDISGSMSQLDSECGGAQRYTYMLEAFKSFIKTAEAYDKHEGPTVMLFGQGVQVFKDTTLADVSDKLDNVQFENFTNTHLVIDKAYELHKAEKRELAREGSAHPGTALLIFTDGAASSEKFVEQSIVSIANSLDLETEFTITFLTVGTMDRKLRVWLDDLHDKVESQLKQDFDIFHWQRLEETTFFNAIAGSAVHAKDVA